MVLSSLLTCPSCPTAPEGIYLFVQAIIIGRKRDVKGEYPVTGGKARATID